MKQLITLFFLFISLNADAQFFKKIFRHSTIYTSGSIGIPLKEDFREFFVTQAGDVKDITREPEFDYRYSIGWRKLARFDYENRANTFYDGSEKNITLSAGIGSVENWEWLANYDWVRRMGHEFNNKRFFIRYLGPWYVIKGESREEGAIDFNYQALDVRLRLPIGNKFNISLGGIYRTSDKVFGYNPIEEFLAPDSINWWNLAYDKGYTDHYYGVEFDDNKEYDWWWADSLGVRIADSDLDFRKHIYKQLVNEYNQEKYREIGRMAYVSAVVGYDFYHYNDNFWLHNYVSLMPLHKQIKGDTDFGYGLFYQNQNDGKKQWVDYQAGLVLGWKVKKVFGFFLEGEYSKLWDKDIYNAKVGFNINFK